MPRLLFFALIAGLLCASPALAGDAKLTVLYSANNYAEVHPCPS